MNWTAMPPRSSGFYFFIEMDSRDIGVAMYDATLEEVVFHGDPEPSKLMDLKGFMWSSSPIVAPDVPKNRILDASMLEEIAAASNKAEGIDPTRVHNIPASALRLKLRNGTGKEIPAGARVTFEARPGQKLMVATRIVIEDEVVGPIAAPIEMIKRNGSGECYQWIAKKARR